MQQFATLPLDADPLALLATALRSNAQRANDAPEHVGALLYSALRRDQRSDDAIERALRVGLDELYLRIAAYEPQTSEHVRWRAPGPVTAIHSVDGLTAICCTNALMFIDASDRVQTVLAPRLTASAAFGLTVITGDAEGTVTLWHSFAQIDARVAAHRAEVTQIVFTTDAAYSCAADGMIVRWEWQDGWQLRSRFDAPGGIAAAAASGKVAAFGCRTGDIFEIGADGTTTIHPRAHDGAVTAIALVGNILISAGGDRMLRVCPSRRPEGAEKIDSGHAMGIAGMVVDDNRKIIVATWALDHLVRIWHVDKSRRDPKLAFELVGHQAAVTAAAFGPGGKEPWLITGSADGEVIRWDEEADPIASHRRHTGAVRAIAFRKKEIVTSGDDARIDRCDYKLAVVPGGGVSATVSAERRVGICSDGHPTVFHDNGWRELKLVATSIALHARNQELISWREGAFETKFGTFDAPVVGCAYVGNSPAAVLADGTVMFESQPIHTNEGSATVMLGGARSAIFGTDKGTVCEVVRSAVSLFRRIDAHNDRVTALAVHENLIASASISGDVAVWGPTDVIFRGSHDAAVSHLAFSTTSALLASVCEDNFAAIWDYRARRRIATCIGHRDRITALVVDDRSRLIYTASLDRTVRAWDFEGAQRGIIYGDHPFSAMTLIPTGVMPGDVLAGDDAGALYTLRYRRDEPEPKASRKQLHVKKVAKKAVPKKRPSKSRSSRIT